MESQIRFTVKEWRQKICGKKSSEDLKKEKGAMNTADVYGRNRFTFFIDLRSMRDSDLNGSGLRLVNTRKKEFSLQSTGRRGVRGICPAQHRQPSA
ncbi:hypothetical protein pdam_00013213 [Pocillopora damicornis]|uniref:Uncharacterized protein n=1 Tax=Pocillopora damicornis TaxID=46731 RepID=A0A3M6UAL3_POCDA|nr:hypothetical protein pdam_00013213 [Pocillopora damicornis]